MSSQLIYPPEECPHPLSRIAPATSTAPMQCTSCGTVEPVDAKAVDQARADAQVIESQCRPLDAKAVDSGEVEDADPDAKPEDVGESLGDYVQRALGIALSAPYQPSTPPAVSPRQAADIYAQARQVDPWPGEDYGSSSLRLPPPPPPPVVVGNTWLDGFARNVYAFRAETPPTPERRAELDRQAAERKAKARRRGARAVARIARDRARGIRPCTTDRERSDDW